jgi:hypothetical protein
LKKARKKAAHAGVDAGRRTGVPPHIQNVIVALSTVPTELVSCTTAATTSSELPVTGKNAVNPKTPAMAELAKYCSNAEPAATVILPGAMALPEELKKLKTSWDVLRVLSQPLI